MNDSQSSTSGDVVPRPDGWDGRCVVEIGAGRWAVYELLVGDDPVWIGTVEWRPVEVGSWRYVWETTPAFGGFRGTDPASVFAAADSVEQAAAMFAAATVAA